MNLTKFVDPLTVYERIASQSNVYLIEILKPVARMPLEMYVQEASMSHEGKRFYVNRGSAGHLSLSVKSCKILACGILYSSSIHKTYEEAEQAC